MKKILKKAVEVSEKAVAFGKKAQPILRTASTVADVASHLLKKKQRSKHKKSKKSVEKTSLYLNKMKKHTLRGFRGSNIKNQILKASAGFGTSELITSFLGPGLFSSGIGLIGSYILAGKIGAIGAVGHFLFKSSGFFSPFPKKPTVYQSRSPFLPRRF